MKNIFSALGVIAAALIMSWTLTSDKISLNHVPRIDKVINSQVFVSQEEDGVLNIYFKSTIMEQDRYTDLIMLLNLHKHDKHVRIHLAGNGGSVASAQELYYTIKSMEGEVTMVIDSNVYSAHALLALAGTKIEIRNPNILFLYHVPAVMDSNHQFIKMEEECKQVAGTDRGISSQEKCEDFVKHLQEELANTMEFLLVNKILTPEQAKQYYEGYDVIITGKQVMSTTNGTL